MRNHLLKLIGRGPRDSKEGGFAAGSSVICCLAALILVPCAGCPSSKGDIEGSNIDVIELWKGAQLRGADIYQRRVYPELDGDSFIGPGPVGPPYTQDDLSALAASGANYVHISHPGLFGEAPPYALDTAVQANLDDLVEKAEKAGLWVVIGFRSGPGRSEFDIHEGQDWFPQTLVNNDIWKNQAAQDAWAAMWKHTAERYRDRHHVAGYDLMVEPNGASVTYKIYDAETFYAQHAGSLADWNHMYPNVLAAVRLVDTQKPVLVSAMQYGSVDWLSSILVSADTRCVYTVHPYLPFEYDHQEPGTPIAYPGVMSVDGVQTNVNKAWLDEQLAPINDFQTAHAALVAATEYGVHRWAPGAAQYMKDMNDLFDSRGLSRAVWLWESSYAGLAETDDFNFRHGPVASHHADVATSDLTKAIEADWSQANIRP